MENKKEIVVTFDFGSWCVRFLKDSVNVLFFMAMMKFWCLVFGLNIVF